MASHFTRELQKLNRSVLEMGALIGDALRRAVRAFFESDRELAAAVVKGDRFLDHLEVTIEEECLKMLALYQPVAKDLRYLSSVLKVNNDLERMGDHAKNIAARLLESSVPATAPTVDLREEVERVVGMVGNCLEAFTRCDTALARWILNECPAVDRACHAVIMMCRARMRTCPEEVDARFVEASVALDLERIADLAKNIAEDVVYLVEGVNVRHQIPAAAGQASGLSRKHLDAILESDPLDDGP